MRNNNFSPASPVEDPWATPAVNSWESGSSSFNPDDWGITAPVEASSWGAPASESSDPWGQGANEISAPVIDSDAERQASRERLAAKVSRKLGEYAAKLSSLTVRGRSMRETFGAEGAVSSGIDSAHSAVDRASRVTDSKTFRVAKHIPGVKKYARTAENIVDTASAISGAARNYSYDSFAQDTSDAFGDQEQLLDTAVGAGKRVAKEALRAGANAVGERYGVSIDKEGNREIRKFKLARSLGRLALNPTRAFKDARVGLEGAAIASRGAALASARGEVVDMRRGIADAYYGGDPVAAVEDPWARAA